MKKAQGIQTQFKIVAFFCAISVAAFTGVHFLASNISHEHAKQLLGISVITQRHMEGDMMHDAMQSDVLSALLARTNDDADAILGAEEDLSAHFSNFRDNLSANQQEKLPDEIKDMFEGALIALNAYHKAGSAVVKAAKSDRPTDQAMEDFRSRFEVMEVENEAISNAIGTWAQREQASADSVNNITNAIAALLALIACGLALMVPLFGARKIFAPLNRITFLLNQISSGKYPEVDGTERQDEIGEIARCVDVFRNSSMERDSIAQQRILDQQKNDEMQRAALLNLADSFEARMKGIVSEVTGAASKLNTSSQSFAGQMTTASDVAGRVSSSTVQTIENVNNVAAAASQMTISIREIAKQISTSNVSVQNAMTEMENATQTSQMLETATNRIGEIVVMIQSITNQINLLSLNATIESARAGEAGKGFAVVANEVKTLADQAAKATEEISNTIANIRDVSGKVVQAIHVIKGTIDTVYSVSSSISAAVEEQSSASGDIAANIGRASEENARIAQDIQTVSSSTQSARGAAADNANAASALSAQAERLQHELHTFLQNVRAA